MNELGMVYLSILRDIYEILPKLKECGHLMFPHATFNLQQNGGVVILHNIMMLIALGGQMIS